MRAWSLAAESSSRCFNRRRCGLDKFIMVRAALLLLIIFLLVVSFI
jgi:hypothetical protein